MNQNNLRNRPTAPDYDEVREARGPHQLEPTRAHTLETPANYYYYKLKSQNNPYLNDRFWREAVSRGEADSLAALLMATNEKEFSSEALDIIKPYGDRVDYDLYVQALQTPFLDNTKKEPWKNEDIYDESGQLIHKGDGRVLGNFTEQERSWEIIKHAIGRFDAELLDEQKENRGFFGRVLTRGGANATSNLLNLFSGGFKFLGDTYNLFEGLYYMIAEWSTNEFLKAFDNDDSWGGNPVGKIGQWLGNASYELQRELSGRVSAVQAYDAGYRRGEGNWFERIDEAYNTGAYATKLAQWTNGMTHAIGYMAPTMLLAAATGGTSFGATAAGKALNASRSLIFYSGIFSGMVKDTVIDAKRHGVHYSELKTGQVLANAAAKAVVQWAIEEILGALLGFSPVDELLGIGKGRGLISSGMKVFENATATGIKAFGITAGRVAWDATKEGLEETFQDLSDYIIDWAFNRWSGPTYEGQEIGPVDVEAVFDSFIVGAMTSIVMGAFSGSSMNMFKNVKENASILLGPGRAVGIDPDGKTYKMGAFQTFNLREAIGVMADLDKTAKDTSKAVQERINAMFAMNSASTILGSLYRINGEERTAKVNMILNAALAEQSKANQGILLNNAYAYTENLWDEFLASTKMTAELHALTKEVIKKEKHNLRKVSDKLKESKVTEIKDVIVESTELDSLNTEIQPSTLTKLKEAIKKFGVKLMASVDAPGVVLKAGSILIVSEDLLAAGDLTTMVEGMSYQLVLDAVIRKLNRSQRNMILSTYNSLTGTDGTLENAVKAMLFDASFYTHLLLLSHKRGYGKTSINVLALLDQIIASKVSPEVGRGEVTVAAYNTLLKKVQKTMQSGIVTFATQYQMLDLDDISPEILPVELKQAIRDHQNVRFTKSVLSGIKEAPTTERVKWFRQTIDKFATMKGVTKADLALIEESKKKVASDNYNDRVDAYVHLAILTKRANSPLKVTFLTYAGGNLLKDALIERVSSMFGVPWDDLIQGRFTADQIPQDTMNFLEAKNYRNFMTDKHERLSALREVLFAQSGKTLTIGVDGTILEVFEKSVIVKSRYLGKEGEANLRADLKANKKEGKSLTVQDMCRMPIDPRIGNLKLEMVSNLISNAFYKDGDTRILLNGASRDLVTAIMHEITHATQFELAVGAESFLGGTDKIFSLLPEDTKKDLSDYLEKNFPVSYHALTMLDNYSDSAQVIYFMLEGELMANSSLSSIMFEVGFTWKERNGNKRGILVSPDGKREWIMEVRKSKQAAINRKSYKEQAKAEAALETKLEAEQIEQQKLQQEADLKESKVLNQLEAEQRKTKRIKEQVEYVAPTDIKVNDVIKKDFTFGDENIVVDAVVTKVEVQDGPGGQKIFNLEVKLPNDATTTIQLTNEQALVAKAIPLDKTASATDSKTTLVTADKLGIGDVVKHEVWRDGHPESNKIPTVVNATVTDIELLGDDKQSSLVTFELETGKTVKKYLLHDERSVLTKVNKDIEISPNNQLTPSQLVTKRIAEATEQDYFDLLQQLRKDPSKVSYDIDMSAQDILGTEEFDKLSPEEQKRTLESAGLMLMNGLPVRRLTPLERGRLMGVPDAAFKRMAERQSNNRLNALTGNSIVVDVLEHMFKAMVDQNVINKPARLIELFGGYGSQRMAMDKLKADPKYKARFDYEAWKLVEWASSPILAYQDAHHYNDRIDYTENMTKPELIKALLDYGFSFTGNAPATRAGLSHAPLIRLQNIYNAIKNTNNLVDINKVADTPTLLDIKDTDKYDYIMTYSFPCQDLSQAGTRLGAEKGSGTRSSLLWAVGDIIEKLEPSERPKILVMENVPAMFYKANRQNTYKWMELLNKLGYDNFTPPTKSKTLMASNYGIPQKRDRAFIVSILRSPGTTVNYEFPKPIPLKKTVANLLERNVDNSYYLKPSQLRRAILTKPDQDFNRKVLFNLDVAHTLTTSDGDRAYSGNFQIKGMGRNLDWTSQTRPSNMTELAATRAFNEALQEIKARHLKKLRGSKDIDISEKDQLFTGDFEYKRNLTAKFAKSTNSKLINFVKRGKQSFVDPRVQEFVVNTTEGFNNLPSIFKNKIDRGTLNRWDITEYVATASNMNTYTLRMIAKHVYHNDAMAKLTAKELNTLFSNITDYATLAHLLDETALTNQTLTFKELDQQYNKVYDETRRDEKLAKAWAESAEYVQKIKPDLMQDPIPIDIDIKQLSPLFFNHYQGTLSSLLSINNLAKKLAYKQQLKLLDREAADSNPPDNTEGGKKYTWLDNMKRSEVVYDYDDNNIDTAIADIDYTEKIQAIKEYESMKFVAQFKHLTEAEKRANFKQMVKDWEVIEDSLYNLDDAATDAKYKEALYYQQTGTFPTAKAAATETAQPSGPTKKTLKDSIKNATNNLIKRYIANSKVKYRQLAQSVQAIIDPTTFKLDTTVYADYSLTELKTLLEDVRWAARKIKEAGKKSETFEKALRQKEKQLAKVTKQLAESTRIDPEPSATRPVAEGGARATTSRAVRITKIINQEFSFESGKPITDTARKVLNTQWASTKESQVKSLTSNAEQNVHNGKLFYLENMKALQGMSVHEAMATAEWFLETNIVNVANNSAEAQTFAAVRLYFLGYLYDEIGPGGMFSAVDDDFKDYLDKQMRSLVTVGGTVLSVWKTVNKKLSAREVWANADIVIAGVALSDDDKDSLMQAVVLGDIDAIDKIQQKIIENIKESRTTKNSILRTIAAIRSRMMLSGPMTALRNLCSNVALRKLNAWSKKIGDLAFGKQYKEGQLKLDATVNEKLTPEVVEFINQHFVENGLYKTLVGSLSKYNPSNISPKFKDAAGNVQKDVLFADMVIKSLYSKFYNDNFFKNETANKINKFLMKLLSDNKYVELAALDYFGKILIEKGYDLTQGLTDAIVNDFAIAVSQGMRDYMHSNNIFNAIESVLAEHSESALFVYKLILPFASASWNWFKAALRFTPFGLGRAIVKLHNLEREIIKNEAKWNPESGDFHKAGLARQLLRKYTEEIPTNLVEFTLRRDFGAGVIGTVGCIFGMLLAGMGFVQLEDEDYGTPKLRIGDLRINMSSLFGSSSVLAGMAFIQQWEQKDFFEGLNAMLDPFLDGFFLTQVMELDKYSRGGNATLGVDFMEQTVLSFIPNLFRWLSGATYSGQLKYSSKLGLGTLQRATARIPFLASAFNLDKKVDVFTGETDDWWQVVKRVVPYLEVRRISMMEEKTKALGLNKKELRGVYEVNGEDFVLSPKEVAIINKFYGELNATALVDFYNNTSKHDVELDNGKFRKLTYEQMTDAQRKNVVQSIMSKNSGYVKIAAWLKAGNSYYASPAEYQKLRALGMSGNLYKGTKGFVKK